VGDIGQEIRELQQQAAEQGKRRARAEAEAAAAAGRRDGTLAALREEFGVASAEDARELDGKLEEALRLKAAQARELLARAGGQ
jgi:hypothetical protein